MACASLSRPRLSVAIPCYNEEESLSALLDRTSAACLGAVGESYEIILINDGSKDNSWSLMAAIADSNPHIVAINLARNYGHQLALSAGLQQCRGDIVLVLDADLQDPPELLGDMIALIEQGFDVVYGQRLTREGETFFKRTTATLFYRILQKMVDVHIPRDTGDFRLMTRRVVEQINAMPERYRFIRGMVSWVGFRQAAFPYHREARFAGETKYPLAKMLAFAVDAITSFSVKPLRLAAMFGTVAGGFGLLMLGWVLQSYLRGQTVAGWASLSAIILILGSLQMLLLGVIGEYVGRMYMESKRRPLFLIDEICAQPREEIPNPVHALNRTIGRSFYA